MRRTLGIAAAIAILTAVAAGWRASPNQDAALQGAWVRTSVTDTSGNVNSEPQPGLFVFTGTHYSIMYVNRAEPREQFAAGPAVATATDAELVAAFRSVVANSGRYEVNGDQITYRAYVAKNPNYMGGWPENETTVAFRIEGDTLHWTWSNGAVFTLRRVEGEPVPW
jgi:hypothetical protein